MGVVGLAENKANSAPLELEFRLSLVILSNISLLVMGSHFIVSNGYILIDI